MRRLNKSLIVVLLLGFLLRLAIMFWSFNFRENTDVLRWRDWGRIAYLHNLADTYKMDYITFGTYPNNMPPGTLYNVHLMYQSTIQLSKVLLRIFHLQAGEAHWMNGPLLNGMLRIPSLLADAGIAILVYLLVRIKHNPKPSLIGASLFYFNPAVMYNSAFWGQMDSINNIFFMLAIFLFFRNRLYQSVISYFLSLYIKFSLIFLLPLYILTLYKKIKNVKQIILPFLVSGLVVLVLTLPISVNPHNWWFSYLEKNSLGEMDYITNFAFNFWWAVYKPAVHIISNTNLFEFSEIRLVGSPPDSQTFVGIPLRIWGIILFIAGSIPFYWRLLRSKKTISLQTTFLLFSLSTILGFLFLPRMHERYMYPVFPLLATYVGLTQKKYWMYILLSLLHLINLYIVWHPMRLMLLPYEYINNQQIQWLISIGIVTISFVWYIQSIKELYAEKNR